MGGALSFNFPTSQSFNFRRGLLRETLELSDLLLNPTSKNQEWYPITDSLAFLV